MSTAEFLTSEVPDPEAAKRFLEQLGEAFPSETSKLCKDAALLSDVLTLVSYSPLFAATLLQDPGYIAWLRRERVDSRVRDKQTLLESLGRFSLMHSSMSPNVMLARFRRRELMRIFLRDARRLSTVAEITEEISNLADAVLEYAMRLSKQELDNRFGIAQEEDDRGRLKPSQFCIVALGKLGSRELNYASDIDLLFIFSKNGTTSGSGSHGATSNLEYFSKLTQAIIKLVGGQGGEGAAYRVDMRLRPHGKIGPLALTLDDTVRYYKQDAAAWERQVLIRSRAASGSRSVFRAFFRSVEDIVFSPDVSVEAALENVALSKQKIDLQTVAAKGIDIKLGVGGIREIEFIAQSLQLAHGGKDKWLRVAHTLVSLDRLAERGHLSGNELAELFAAYGFFRHLEHILQIENGLQTHLVPRDLEKRSLIAKRIGLDVQTLDSNIESHTQNVNRVFARIFVKEQPVNSRPAKAANDVVEAPYNTSFIEKLKKQAPRFSEIIAVHPEVIGGLQDVRGPFPERDYSRIIETAVARSKDFTEVLHELRRSWHRLLIEIVAFDALGNMELAECKRLQTELAAASLAAALQIGKAEAAERFGVSMDDIPLAVLALGKLAGGGLDYDSDLDLVFVHGDVQPGRKFEKGTTTGEYFSRVIEVFTTVLSSITRDGLLYRVDLRLRPHGNDGPLVISRSAILDYFQRDAAIWQMLAFVKLRAVGGNIDFARSVENDIRSVIHEKACEIEPVVLASDTRAVRDKLEKQRTSPRSNEIDFKYGPGGLLDVYFAVRFLQLRLNIPDVVGSRNTDSSITRISLSLNKVEVKQRKHRPSYLEALSALRDGYAFLSEVDHLTRLSIGRQSHISNALNHLKRPVGDRCLSPGLLTLQRIRVRESFEKCLEI